MSKLSNLALAGLIGGLGLSTTSCNSNSQKKHESSAEHAGYSEIHACAGHNSCKGLGGCAVDQAKLEQLAKKRGIPASEAGEPHACAGHNECKGLGGCSVDAEKLKKLKAKRGH